MLADRVAVGWSARAAVTYLLRPPLRGWWRGDGQ